VVDTARIHLNDGFLVFWNTLVRYLKLFLLNCLRLCGLTKLGDTNMALPTTPKQCAIKM